MKHAVRVSLYESSRKPADCHSLHLKTFSSIVGGSVFGNFAISNSKNAMHTMLRRDDCSSPLGWSFSLAQKPPALPYESAAADFIMGGLNHAQSRCCRRAVV